jgi:hypothetical protein
MRGFSRTKRDILSDEAYAVGWEKLAVFLPKLLPMC